MATLGTIAAALRAHADVLEGLEAGRATPVAGPLAWGARVSPTFRERVRWIADELGFEADWLMACMAFETGRTFSPKVRNPSSTATGLIQFMAATAKELGTTTADLARLSAEDQLKWVYRYFEPYRGRIWRLSDCYMAILNPVAIGRPDGFEMWVKGGRAYAANAGLDRNKDHRVTKAEAAAKVHALLAEGLQPENRA